MHWLVEFLFWPWWRAIGELKNAPADDLVATATVVICATFIALSIIVLKVWMSKKHDPPPFLKTAMSLLLLFLLIGTAGGLSNMAVVNANEKGKMPNWSEHGNEDSKHYNTTEGGSLKWLSNWIDTDFHPRIGFFFRGYRHISPGDVTIAISIISVWWTFLAVIIYSMIFTAKKILKI